MVAGVALQDAFGNGNHAVAIALKFAQQSKINVHNKRKRIEAAGGIELRFGFGKAAVRHQAESVILMGAGIAWVQLEGFFVFALGGGPVVIVMGGDHAQRGVRFGE